MSGMPEDGRVLSGLVTLDGRGDWSDPERVHVAMQAWSRFLVYLRKVYRVKDGWQYAWRAELQSRGALHWHYFLVCRGDMDAWDDAVGRLVELEDWEKPRRDTVFRDRTKDELLSAFVKADADLGEIGSLSELAVDRYSKDDDVREAVRYAAKSAVEYVSDA